MTTSQMELLSQSTHVDMPKNLCLAITALQDGKTILLLDAHDRENEGDLIVAAEKITPSSMNFLIKHGSGIVCLPMTKMRLELLGLPPMLPENTNSFQTAFTVSIEARCGVTTGVSAKDRAHTIQTAMADDAKSSDLARPGHVFPLAAANSGVFARMGHTEGSVDLMRLAGLKPGAVLCELMNDDGSMTVGDDRVLFAKRFNMPVVSVEEILFYRMKTEDVFKKTTKNLDTRFGNLLWSRFNFLNQMTIDVFLKPVGDFGGRAVNVSLVTGDNLLNRYMGQILKQTPDDPLVYALFGLAENNHDVVIMAQGEMAGNKSHDMKSRIEAAICRTLREVNVKKLSQAGIGVENELLRVAQQYFSIDIC